MSTTPVENPPPLNPHAEFPHTFLPFPLPLLDDPAPKPEPVNETPVRYEA